MMKKIVLFCLLILACPAFHVTIEGKDTRRRLVKPSRRPVLTADTHRPVPWDTITDSDVINRYVSISDYQKALGSRVESMLLTNLSASDTIKALTVDLNYTNAAGQQINRRVITLTETIPPLETRHVSFRSWDRQQLFFYRHTPPKRPGPRARSFDITINPVSLLTSSR